MRKVSYFIAALVIGGAVAVAAQERIDQDVFWKIRQEGTNNSKILPTLHVLTDVYGPRLTGSPNLKAAGEWAIEQMHAWGLKEGRLEPWDFARSGWTNERLAAHIVSPVKDALVAEALAWTPGTNGIVRAQAVQLTLPQRPTRDVLTTHLDALKDVVKGKFVLVGVPQTVLVTFNAPALRREDADVVTQLNAAPAGPPQQNQQPQRAAAREAGGTAAPDEQSDTGAAQPVPDRERCGGADQRRRSRSRSDSCVQQRGLRRGEGAADGGDAQRGLRAHLASARRQAQRRARVRHRQSHASRGADQLQRHCGDPRFGQGGRSRHARRASRFVARRDWRHRQCDRMRRDDGGCAHSRRDRRSAAAHDSRGSLERRGAGAAGVAGVREGALRDG